ncbi:hypothetical protein FVE85_1054 [Porphyridium purpureum]|uniref:EcxA zinc-binding domain-containing protein n=1 Tax=Porphyridium purpureum TaxID=35688 RepID=A0A5J4Z219_PORPP|nr:hypothetical protein FVE85_1054 [Porphyridium purpureum]|eukprot:POR8878..scf208_2
MYKPVGGGGRSDGHGGAEDRPPLLQAGDSGSDEDAAWGGLVSSTTAAALDEKAATHGHTVSYAPSSSTFIAEGGASGGSRNGGRESDGYTRREAGMQKFPDAAPSFPDQAAVHSTAMPVGEYSSRAGSSSRVIDLFVRVRNWLSRWIRQPIFWVALVLAIGLIVVVTHASGKRPAYSTPGPGIASGPGGVGDEGNEYDIAGIGGLGGGASPRGIPLSGFTVTEGMIYVLKPKPGALGMGTSVKLGVPRSFLNVPFIVTVIFTRADAQSTLLHMPGSEYENNWFAFRLSEDETALELYQPSFNVRVASQGSELEEAYKEGVARGALVKFGTAQAEGFDGYIIDSDEYMAYGFLVFPHLRMMSPDFVDVLVFERNLNMQYDVTVSDQSGSGSQAYARLQFSLIQLPDSGKLMKARPADSRIGYFTQSYFMLDTPTVRHRRKDIIHRWNLRSANGRSEIVYYIDPTVPEAYRATVKAGIEAWNKALEAAGLSDHEEVEKIIRAVSPGDADWPQDYHPGDVKYSSISWAPSLYETFALGPSDSDPRTGEILQADIVFTHSWIRAWYSEFETFLGMDDWIADVDDTDRAAASDGHSTFDFISSRIRHAFGGASSVPNARRNSGDGSEWPQDYGFASLSEMNGKAQAQTLPLSGMKPERARQVQTFRAVDDSELDIHFVRHLGSLARHHAHQEMVRSLLESNGSVFLSEYRMRAVEKFDEFMHAALKAVVMHEVGHTLGLRHNFRASANTPWAQLSNASYVAEHGICTSVMDYIALHVQADPARQTEYFMTVIGDYDIAAIKYGYAHPDTGTRQELEDFARHTVESGLLFMTDEDDPSVMGEDPFSSTFDLSDDLVAFAENQLELAEKLLAHLLERASVMNERYTDVTTDFMTIHKSVLRSLDYVVKLIGGVESVRFRAQSGKEPKAAVDAVTERAAVELLLRVLNPVDGFLGVKSMSRFAPFLVQEFGSCDAGASACFGFQSVSALDIARSFRFGLFQKLLHPLRIERMQRNLLLRMSASRPDAGSSQTLVKPLHALEIFHRVGDVFFKSLLEARQYERDDAQTARTQDINETELEALAYAHARMDWVDWLYLMLETGLNIQPGYIKSPLSAELTRLSDIVAEAGTHYRTSACSGLAYFEYPLSSACALRSELSALSLKLGDFLSPHK